MEYTADPVDEHECSLCEERTGTTVLAAMRPEHTHISVSQPQGLMTLMEGEEAGS